ncbi:unnamed protein product [Boreogadus saida]
MTLKMTRKWSTNVPRCTTEYRTRFRRDVGRARTAGLHQDHRLSLSAEPELAFIIMIRWTRFRRDVGHARTAGLHQDHRSLTVTRKLVYQRAVAYHKTAQT